MVSSRSRATRSGSAGGREEAGSAARRRARSSSCSSLTTLSPLSTPHVRPPARPFAAPHGLSPGPVQPDARRVGRDLEDGGDLAGRQLLPRPQAEQLRVLGPQRGHGLQQLVVPGVRGRADWSGGATTAIFAASRSRRRSPRCDVGQAVAGDAVRPWQRVVRHVVQPAPAHQQRVGENVVGRRRIGTTRQVAPQRIDQLPGELLEAGPPVGLALVGGHPSTVAQVRRGWRR